VARSANAPRCAPLILRLGAAARCKRSRANEIALVEPATADLAYPPEIVQQRQNHRYFDRGFKVTDDLDRQVRQALQRQKRSRGVVLIPVVLLAVIAAAGSYVWLNFDGLVQEFSIAAHPGRCPGGRDSGEEA
jgi:hypothetical protein